MELGLALEDEDLGETRDRSSAPILTSFNAKVCTPRWYEREVPSVDATVSENNSQLLKFNGDFQYYKENFKSASEFYQRSLAVLPSNSAATRLDIHQSLCRCYLKMGQRLEAEQISKDLISQAQNNDQIKQAALLRLEVLQALANHIETECCLVLLIGQQPHLSQLWLQLAEVITKLDTGSDPEVTIKLVTCYVRVRLLLQSTMSAVSCEVQQRDQKTITMVERQLQGLGASPDLLRQAREISAHKQIMHSVTLPQYQDRLKEYCVMMTLLQGLRFDLKQDRDERVEGGGDQQERGGDQPQQLDSAPHARSNSRHSQLEDPVDFYKFWCDWALSRPT